MDSKTKAQLSESDICDQFISPALKDAGWDWTTQVRRDSPVHVAARYAFLSDDPAVLAATGLRRVDDIGALYQRDAREAALGHMEIAALQDERPQVDTARL